MTKKQSKKKAPVPSIQGEPYHITAEQIEETYQRYVKASRKAKSEIVNRDKQQIIFDSGPICIVCASDFHIGNVGTDIDRIDRDLKIINETPGMYLGIHGDVLDNFVIGRLALLNMTRKFTIKDEWILVKRFLEMATPKMLWNVSGNHDNWSTKIAGIDFLAEQIQQFNRNVLYHSDQLYFTVRVGRAEYRFLVRHKWKGNSQWNPLHAIWKHPKFDNKPFDIGIGGHTHQSGVYGTFNLNGETSLGVLSGAYKRHDKFAVEVGFPAPNDKMAIAIVLDDKGNKFACDSLEMAAAYMGAMYHE